MAQLVPNSLAGQHVQEILDAGAGFKACQYRCVDAVHLFYGAIDFFRERLDRLKMIGLKFEVIWRVHENNPPVVDAKRLPRGAAIVQKV